MIKTILIATDFSLESLHLMKKVLRDKNSADSGIQFNILLVSGYDAGDSIRNLLFNTKGKIFNKIISKEFSDAYNIIKNKYPHLVNKVMCDVFTGNFQRTFDQYLITENVEEAYYTDYLQDSISKRKFNLAPFLKKNSVLEAQEIKTPNKGFLPEKGKIAEVFVEV